MMQAFLLATLAMTSPSCPLGSLQVDRDGVVWAELRIGARSGDIEQILQRPLDLVENTESPGHHAELVLGDRPVVLHFDEGDSNPRLVGIVLKKTDDDDVACWSLERLVAQVKTNVSGARYLASRHEPEETEAENETPMFVLSDDDTIVALLKPSHGTIYLGRLSVLD